MAYPSSHDSSGYASYGGGFVHQSSSSMNLPYDSPDVDPLDAIAPSTVAMVILFGSVLITTVGMATRALLWGDKRAIFAAISIKVNPATLNSNINSNSYSYSGISNGHGESSVRGDSSSLATHSMGTRTTVTPHSFGTNATTMRIRPWEPTFISTFVLFYQLTLFGMILFGVFLLDNHPPHGAARSQSTGRPSTNSEFDEDQFVFWLIVLVGYGYFVSWKRNDGKSTSENKPQLPSTLEQPTAPTPSSGNIVRRKMKGPIRRRTAGSSVGSKSSAADASSQGSDDINKRLEEVLLDDEASFNNILDTIEGDIKDKKDKNDVGWIEQGSKLLGLYFDESGDNIGIPDVKSEEDVLNRYQTLELKGFLSAALLFYHFNNGGIHQPSLNDENESYVENGATSDRTNVYNNLCSVAVSSFFFLSGYGHTSYFYYHPAKNHDSYRFSRVLIIICRINLSAAFLSLVIGKAEYTACTAITTSFLLIWLTMRFHQSINYDKFLFRIKLFGLAVCIFIFWDCDISKFFSESIMQNSLRPIWEWYSFSHAHHWAAFMGMIFAINQPIASFQLRKLESLNALTQILAKGLIFIALCAAVMIWTAGPLQMPSFAYGISHPYFGIVPLLWYIYFRNICGRMRQHHIGCLSYLGKYSLEVYLLHHHAFTDGGCISLIPGYPRCNFAAMTMLLLFTARVLHNLTAIFQHMILPEKEESKCIQHSSSAFFGVTMLYVFAKALSWAGMTSVGTISTITIICGILLYQAVLDMTWAEYRDSGLKLAHHHSSASNPAISIQLNMDESTAAKVSPPLIGTTVFFIGCCLWSFSRSTLQPCGATANNGHWVPVNPCLSRGKLHRKYHTTNYFGANECSRSKDTNLQWTWPENSQHKHCRYRYRSNMEVQQQLKGKKVVLIGDSSVRSLFQSLCRYMGDQNVVGFAEDTTPAHSDAVKTFGTSTIEYKWAPLTVDIITKLRALKNSGFASPMKRLPDLVVAGGGAWDRLHLSVTDEDPQSQKETVSKLVKSLSEVNLPLIWFTPPTINTKALNSDEKRIQMSEESIEEMRQMYDKLGVASSVSFVLDGPSFTRERTTESFDGVHYPAAVYNAGAQIVFNALDWLMFLPNSAAVELHLPKPGSLGIPYLGLMMICIAIIGLFFFDGYLGFSYLAQVFVLNDTVSPGELHDDAFTPIFKRLKSSQKYVKAAQVSSDDDESHDMTEFTGPGRSLSSLSRRR